MRTAWTAARNILLLAVVCIIAAHITYTPACGSGREGVSFHLDPSLQAAAEHAVGKRSACVVALDPRTGRILALVNEEMACRKAFPPGSTMKLITAFAGLEEGLETPETTVECRNYYKSGGETLICSKEGGHGKMDLEHALAHSCNVYFYRLGERLGVEKLTKYVKLFGLRPMIGRSGIARAAIGEVTGLKVTPMRMAVITAAIANGGTEYSPEMGTSGKPTVVRRIRARPGTYPLLRRGMRAAVVEGTARKALVPGLNVCGKTGSPAVEDQPEYRHAWFIGFAPYDRPTIAIVIFCEWGHGADQAAPIAGKVLQAYYDGATGRRGDRGK